MTIQQDIRTFWLEDCTPQDWYVQNAELDARILRRFGAAWRAALNGDYQDWPMSPEGALAFLILTDQFPRNMFRGHSNAFATDAQALAAAKQAVARGDDLEVAGLARQFFYLPFEHSEDLTDQDQAVALIGERAHDPSGQTLLHARVHREIIRRFGRFPYRNKALGRDTTPDEQEFLDAGGYGAALKDMTS